MLSVSSCDKFLDKVSSIYNKKKKVLVAVSEGIKTANGEYLLKYRHFKSADSFGHLQLGGVAQVLCEIVGEHLHLPVRSIELNLPQRCAACILSKTDVEDLAMGFIRFDNGACLQIEFSWASNIEYDQMFVELRGTKSGSRMSGIDRKFDVFTEECGTNITIKPAIDDYNCPPHHEQNIRHFIDVVYFFGVAVIYKVFFLDFW